MSEIGSSLAGKSKTEAGEHSIVGTSHDNPTYQYANPFGPEHTALLCCCIDLTKIRK